MDQFPVIKKGIYRHSKTAKEYEVLGIALQTETGDPLVIYRPTYNSEYELFARPYSMFVELVDINDTTVARFERIQND